MSEELLRDKLSKVMAEKRIGGINLQADQPEVLNTEEKPATDELNSEWKAFYEAIRIHMQEMRT